MRPALAFQLVTVFAVSLPGLVFPQNAKAPSQKPLPQDYSFTIPANRFWTDTGIDLKRGDRIHVTGPVIACAGPSPSEKEHLPLPSAPAGALLLKLHLESNPILASPDADLPIIGPSHLYFGVNGWQCHGTAPARVHVEWHQPPAKTP